MVRKKTLQVQKKVSITYLRFPRRGGHDFNLSCFATARLRFLFLISSSSSSISCISSDMLKYIYVKKETIRTKELSKKQRCPNSKIFLPVNFFCEILFLLCLRFCLQHLLASGSFVQYNSSYPLFLRGPTPLLKKKG